MRVVVVDCWLFLFMMRLLSLARVRREGVEIRMERVGYGSKRRDERKKSQKKRIAKEDEIRRSPFLSTCLSGSVSVSFPSLSR